MKLPVLSPLYRGRQPSAIRVASIRFAQRTDDTRAVNVAIGNVSLPMHPAMVARMRGLGDPGSPFAEGVVRYTPTVGNSETNDAFLRLIESSGGVRQGLHSLITDGGSQGMELVIAGVCGDAGTNESPLLMIDAAYTNYMAFANRLGRRTVSIRRQLLDDGHFALPDFDRIERVIEAERPGALVVIPYDNPTGHFYDQASLVQLAQLCVKHNLWMISDEAYRELFYSKESASSIWKLTEKDVPGISGRRISLETASKVWNACGLRVGAVVTDNAEFHRQCEAEYTANLCANAIGQHIFGALAHESTDDLHTWYDQQRGYYFSMLERLTQETREQIPGAIVSQPAAALYSVVDLRNVVDEGFEALDFVLFCATEGKVTLEGEHWTLLAAPMGDFYHGGPENNPGRTQLRIAYVQPPDEMARVPRLLSELLGQYRKRK